MLDDIRDTLEQAQVPVLDDGRANPSRYPKRCGSRKSYAEDEAAIREAFGGQESDGDLSSDDEVCKCVPATQCFVVLNERTPNIQYV